MVLAASGALKGLQYLDILSCSLAMYWLGSCLKQTGQKVFGGLRVLASHSIFHSKTIFPHLQDVAGLQLSEPDLFSIQPSSITAI